MKTTTLKKGDFIVIKFGKKLANAKVINPPNKMDRMNVFAQGTLKWIDASDFVRMGERGSSLKAGEFITNKENLKRTKESSEDIKNEIEELGKPGTHVLMNDKVIPLSGKTVRIEKESSMSTIVADAETSDGELVDFKTSPVVGNLSPGEPVMDHTETKKILEAELTETDEMYLAPFHKGKTGKSLTVEQVSDMVGKSTPATAHALHRLHGLGFLELLNSELKEYALSIKGLKHVPGSAKSKSNLPKLKTNETGEVSFSKKDRVLALLKNPDLTVKEISVVTGASQSYIRGIRERAARKMDVPEEGTVKRKVYDALRAGGTLVDVSKRCKVTISYAYQIRQQMLSAKII